MSYLAPLTVQQLRTACHPEQFGFRTTDELEDLTEVIGQMRAMEAIRFGAGILRLVAPATAAVARAVKSRRPAKPAGADLLRRERIALTDAVLGATLTVPTLDGSIRVEVPPGTQPGAVLRLKGKGLPEFGSGRCGELYLRIEVEVPEKLSREERELYEKLRALGKGAPKSGFHWWKRE